MMGLGCRESEHAGRGAARGRGGGARVGTRAPTPAPRGRHGTRAAIRLTTLALDSSPEPPKPRTCVRHPVNRLKGDMASPGYLLVLIATLDFIASTYGGPLGPLPNVTSADAALKEESCVVGDVVYTSGEEFPGAGTCERCTCEAGSVRCARPVCAPRPGCKALHRPDHCCPTYQCECEQEGRVYGNGEKLVDPADPCRVCYCQGGEVVCRRIACFVRDDCTPRLVPGRCCPEYDNCPLRGVTSLPGITSMPSISPVEPVNVVPSPPKEVKQEFTIKEITPVSEIPIITEVKIKEILPSPSNEVSEYSSSKSPLIPREATSEKSSNVEIAKADPEVPSIVEIHPSSQPASSEVTKAKVENNKIDDAHPSKISLSTQDSINSDIYPSNVPIVASMGVPAAYPNDPAPVATTTKAPIVDEEDPSLFVDHNPAFPPLPDDFSVLSNHGDEIVPEMPAETDHVPVEPAPTPEVVIASVTPTTEVEESKEPATTTAKYITETSTATTEKLAEYTVETSTEKLEGTSSPAETTFKPNPAVNLRSAIPTELRSAQSEEISREDRESVSSTVISESSSTVTSTTTPATTATSTTTAATPTTQTTPPATEAATAAPSSTTADNAPSSSVVLITEGSKSIEDMSVEDPAKSKNIDETRKEEQNISNKFEETLASSAPVPSASAESSTDEPEIPIERVSFFVTGSSDLDATTPRVTESPAADASPTTPQEQTTNFIAKSNVATEVTSQTELSSLPIETSDQNPHEASENASKDMFDVSTEDLLTANKFSPSNSEVITVSKTDENGAIDHLETTEIILKAVGSSETATDAVEVIKLTGDTEKSAPIIDNTDGNKNALTDLIKLVSDVASISEHTEAPFPATTAADSDELIPVNAGYKSKNSNFNQNSITEVPSFKSKSGAPANKQKIVEIEDDEDGGITDSPPPHDKVEPTTRRPIIDNVSDDMPEAVTERKDNVEIITHSYVPTLNRRPTKVVQEKPLDDAPPEVASTTVGAPAAQ